MDLNQFKTQLKAGNPSGVYIFLGEEDYLIRHYLGELRRVVCTDDAFAVFNNPVFDGSEVDFGAVLEAIKSPPMMSDLKLIEWRHADFSSMKENELASLEELCTAVGEYPYSVVAFSLDGDPELGTPKKPSAFMKRFDKILNILRFDKSTENQLYAWLKKHFEAQGVGVGLETVQALVFRSGRSMDALAGEVKKLSALALSRGRTVVTPEDVNEVASSTPECDTFALSNAILERNKQKAYDALEEMKLRRLDPNMVMGMIARTLGDLTSVAMLMEDGLGADKIAQELSMNEYKLKIYFSAAKRFGAMRLCEILKELTYTDAGSKYGGISGYTAVELFISKNI